MIIRKHRFFVSIVMESKRPVNSKFVPEFRICSLLFLSCLMSIFLSPIVYGLHRPYGPPPHWSKWSNYPRFNYSENTISPMYNDTLSDWVWDGSTTEATTADMPVGEDNRPIDEVIQEYNDNPDDIADEYDKKYGAQFATEAISNVTRNRSEDQVILIRPTPVTPNTTTTEIPQHDGTEQYEEDDTSANYTPEEELHQMLESLDNLLSNESAVVTVVNVTNTFDQLDVLLDTEDLEIPCSMLQALDALGARADLNGSHSMATARHNVAVVMVDSTPGRPVRGLRIAAADFSDEGFEILEGDMDPTTLSTDSSDAVVNLPHSLAETSRRISFVVFRSDRAFVRPGEDQRYIVNSKVISVNVENFTQMGDGEVIDIHFKPSVYKPPRNMTRACAYWHFAENGTGYWSQDGCKFILSNIGQLDTCRCTHLTHFAEVLVPKAVFSVANEKALEIISIIGCCLSLFGLLIIGLTAIVFRSWRNDFNNKIWIQLSLALTINVTCFLITVFSRFEYYTLFCFFVGLLLHYSVLASFCWMLVAAIISYRKLVLIFARDPSRKLLKASAFSWFFPLTVVTILVAVDTESYVRKFEEMTPNGAICYPSGLGLWLTVYAPISIIVLSNWVLFALILRSVFATTKIQKHGDSSEILRRASVSCLLVFLFGLPWVFGLFAYNIVAAYLFTFTTSYQGFVLFIFFVIINTKTRGLWLNKLRIKKKSKAPVSTSQLTNRSEPVRDPSEQEAFIEPNTTRTNVTSLTSNSSAAKAISYNVERDSAVFEDSHSDYRDESEGSFKTAQSFNNICDEIGGDLNDIEENCKKSVNLPETTSQPNKVHEDSQSEKDIATTSGEFGENDSAQNLTDNKNNNSLERKVIASDSVSIEKVASNTNDENDLVVDLNISKLEQDTLGGIPGSNTIVLDEPSNKRNAEASSQNNGTNTNITIYNVPVESASLIS